MQKSIIFLLLLFLLPSGCAPQLNIKKVDPGKPLSLSENEAVVFGKVRFIEKGETNPWGVPVVLTLFHVESEKYNTYVLVEKDGSFFWIVPRGTYIISEIKGYEFTILPQIAFQAPLEADAYYLGTLIIDLETRKILAVRYIKKLNDIRVEDEFDKARDALMNRNPDFTGKVGKNQMIYDTSIPIDTSLYTQRKLLGILNAIGFGLLTIH